MADMTNKKKRNRIARLLYELRRGKKAYHGIESDVPAVRRAAAESARTKSTKKQLQGNISQADLRKFYK